MPTSDTSAVEHDLRNRLAVALGFARQLSETALSQQQRRYVDELLAVCGNDPLARLRLRLGLSAQAESLPWPLEAAIPAVVEQMALAMVTELVDDRNARRRVQLERVGPPSICSHCSEPVDMSYAGLGLHTGRAVMTPLQARAALARHQEAVDRLHALGGHIALRAGKDFSAIAWFLPLDAPGTVR